MRFAVINTDNVVVNVIEAPEGWSLENYTLVESDTSSIGDNWDGEILIPPEIVVPGPTLGEQYALLETDKEKIAFLAQHAGLS